MPNEDIDQRISFTESQSLNNEMLHMSDTKPEINFLQKQKQGIGRHTWSKFSQVRREENLAKTSLGSHFHQ